jgi:DNA-binding response OmpR family regulator
MALAFERTRLELETRETAAFRARDKLRSALLTTIGDDVKPRLNQIQAVLKSMRRDGAADRSLITKLDGEISQVERYIDHLVDLNPGAEYDPLAFGDVVIDLHRRTVHRAGAKIRLTPKEFAVFAELSKHAGRVLTHTQLLRAVWGPAQQDHVDYLRVAVRSLRQKLESDPARPSLIVNEPGIGYRLSA